MCVLCNAMILCRVFIPVRGHQRRWQIVNKVVIIIMMIGQPHAVLHGEWFTVIDKRKSYYYPAIFWPSSSILQLTIVIINM